MSLLVTGSIGIDTVESPHGKAVDALGGSSVYFAYAASFFAPVRFVGVVGEDCPSDFLKPLHDNPRIDMSGLEVRRGAKTFRWHGRYHQDVNLRDTLAVELNVLGEAGPTIPPNFRDSRYAFLANTHPALQVQLLQQMAGPHLVLADTMDLWIAGQPEALEQMLAMVDGIVLNDSEARLMTGSHNVIAAGLEILPRLQRQCGSREPMRGPVVVIKKGEHGSLLFADERIISLPGYPARKIIDPTGAGDSFAGAIMGCLAASGDVSPDGLRRAVAYGTVTASFTLEDFSLNRLTQIDRGQIDRRLAEYQEMLRV